VAVFLTALSCNLYAVDFYSHPEVADKNSLFFNAGVFRWDIPSSYDFPAFSFSLDYMLPVFLPITIGCYIDNPDSALDTFGPRIAYHLDIDNERIDIYLLYIFNLGFLLDDDVKRRYDDVRFGLRFMYSAMAGLFIESGYHFQSLDIGITIKLN
jgi:hypothetical protein